MHPALKKLDTPNAEARLEAAESMLERYTRKQLHGPDTQVVLNELMAFACQESDLDVQDALLEALDTALVYFQGDHATAFQWQVLVDALPKMEVESLQRALPMLSLCGRPDAKAILQSFLTHADAGVQESASFGLDELEMNGGK
jgi:HEAT repeat protein